MQTGTVFLLVFLSHFNLARAQLQVKQAGDYFAFARNGVEITPYEYTEVSSFVEGIAWVNKGDLYGYIDTNLNLITEFVYSDVSAFHNGYAMVARDSTFGFIDTNGTEICPLIYERVKPFEHGVASVYNGMQWSLLNEEGREIMPFQFTYPLTVLSPSFIIVCKDKKWGVIDAYGGVRYPMQYDLITSEGVAYKRDGTKEYLGLL